MEINQKVYQLSGKSNLCRESSFTFSFVMHSRKSGKCTEATGIQRGIIYFTEGKNLFGRDRHPKECDCQRKHREKQEAADKERKHRDTVEDLKRRGFSNAAMRQWTFDNDNGKCPQMDKAHFYAAHWEEMKAENIGYLLWGKVGTAFPLDILLWRQRWWSFLLPPLQSPDCNPHRILSPP